MANERNWTNLEGKTIRGAMVAKTATTVTISVGGKEHVIPLDKLQEQDRKFVNDNSVLSRARMMVRTTKSGGDTNDRGGRYTWDGADTKRLVITVSGTADQPYTVVVGWIGQGYRRNEYGLYRLTTLTFEKDGEQPAECSFTKNTGANFDEEYKGHYVILLDSSGKEIQREASQQPFLRFIGKVPEVK